MADEDSEPRIPVISGDLVYLTTVSSDDAALFARWFKNLEFTAYLGAVGYAATLEDEKDWVERATKKRDDVAHFTIINRATEKPLGNVSLMDIDHRTNTATLGIGIGEPSAWGKGYGAEAVRLMVEYGFYFLSLWNIKLWHVAFNERGHRAYLKAGFKEVGRVRGANLIGGVRYDNVLMDITRDDVDLSRMRSMLKLIEE